MANDMGKQEVESSNSQNIPKEMIKDTHKEHNDLIVNASFPLSKQIDQLMEAEPMVLLHQQGEQMQIQQNSNITDQGRYNTHWKKESKEYLGSTPRVHQQHS